MHWDRELVRKLWVFVDLDAPYDWVPPEGARRALREIVPELPDDLFRGGADEVNRKLRPALAPTLQGADRGRRESLARWVIARWGGIKTNKPTTIVGYVEELGAYGADELGPFLAGAGTKGISSWSKLLAFADPTQHAIYDSRTAVALNCALATLNIARAFYMPPARSEVIRLAKAAIRAGRDRQGNPCTALGYREYISLLRGFVAAGGDRSPRDLLAAEMTIFANARKVAARFPAGTNDRYGFDGALIDQRQRGLVLWGAVRDDVPGLSCGRSRCPARRKRFWRGSARSATWLWRFGMRSAVGGCWRQ